MSDLEQKNLQAPDTPKAVIDSFRGTFGFLSNFHEATFYYEGKPYRSVEYAYQAHKSNDPLVRETIRNAKSPGEAKKLGRAVLVRPDWNEVKFDLMRKFIHLKFDNPFLRPALLATGDAELIHANSWNDVVWGVCRGKGDNWLGRILMEERESIRKEEELEKQTVQNTPSID